MKGEVTMKCSHCGESTSTNCDSLMGDGSLCAECARREVIGLLADCTPDDWKILRRRVEDCLRKRPADLRDVVVALILRQAIRTDDIF